MKYFLSFLLVFSMTIALGQKRTYSSTNKKAIAFLEEGQTMFERGNNMGALEMADKALAKDPDFIEAYILKGYVFMDYKKAPEAITALEKALSIDPNFFPGLYLDLGQLYFRDQRYADCKSILTTYISKFSPKPQQKAKAEFYIECADFSIHALANPVPFVPENLGPNVNSDLKDYLPVISTDENTLIFTRRIPDDRAYQGEQEDFYAAFKQDSTWGKAFNIGKPLNSEVNEGAHALSPDGSAMFLTICELHGNYGQGRMGMGSCDLFVSILEDGSWLAPRNMGTSINSRYHDAQPSMSSDGRTLYFSSARPGGFGKNDIYMSKLTAQGWSKPVNLGGMINTPGKEESVFIHPDGQTLYFTSDGHPGLGESDIFMSRKQPDGTWGKPVNLGYPINTAQDEWGFRVDAKGEYAYYTSDREGGFGDWDIYRFKLPKEFAPKPVTYMTGITYDAQTKQPVRAAFELIDLATGQKVVQSESNGKGEFLVCLPTGKNYALNVERNGYLFFSESFLLEASKSLEPTHKDVPLNKIQLDQPVVLNNIFFDTDQSTLKQESTVELQKLITFLEENPNLKIRIGGHTDNQGSKEHNLQLSKDRAMAVVAYLVQKGISAQRLSFKGYADEVPVASNDTPEGRKLNRRTDFVITEM